MRSTPPAWPKQLGNERAANVVLLGALSTALHFPPADWERTVAEFVPKKTVAVNLEAFRRGRGWIEEARDGYAAGGSARGKGASRDRL